MAVELDLLNSNSLNNITTNFQRVDAAFQDSLSRSGTVPNQMNANIDMNGNNLLNVHILQADDITVAGGPIDGLLNEVLEAVDIATTQAAISSAAAVSAGISADEAAASAASIDVPALEAAIASKQPLDATLTALSGFNTDGILVQTAADTFTGRTLTGTTNKITVTNGSGVAGNPTITIPDAVTLVTPTITGLTTLTGGQIAFPVTAIPSANPNTLDDYEEGTYTPTWTAVTTNPVLGNGILNGWYTKIGNTVTVNISLTMGSTTTYGNGVYSFSLPFPPARRNQTGSGYFFDNGTAVSACSCTTAPDDSPFLYGVVYNGANFIGHSVPVAWANQDRIHFTITYFV